MAKDGIMNQVTTIWADIDKAKTKNNGVNREIRY